MRGSLPALLALVLAGTTPVAVAQQPGNPPTVEQMVEDAANAQPPTEDSAPASAEVADSGAINPNPLASLTLEGLVATRELPLFTPSRSPPVVEATVEEPVVAAPSAPQPVGEEPPPAVQLIGIILTDSKQTAILRNSSTDEVLRLSPGDEIESWALTIVDARSIELRRGDRVEGLKMFDAFPAGGMPEIPGGEGLEPTMSGDFPQQNLDGEMQAMPPMEGLPSPSDGMLGEPAETGSSPVPDTESGTDFAPELGNSPVPEEGAPPAENQENQ